MKIKHLLYCVLALGSFTLQSCDDFLDIQPIGKVIPKTGVRCDCSAIPYYKKGKLELVVQHLRPIAEEAPQA